MDTLFIPLLALVAFGLGAIPFSTIVGRRLLGQDIRDYGDGNPGSANVFRAGGVKAGYLAVFLDIAKGFPVAYLAHTSFDVPITGVIIIGISAILGHAFSPFLRWRGGKAVAVTFGVLLAMPNFEIILSFGAFVIIGALFIDNDAWGVSFGAAGSLAFQFLSRGGTWETLLMACVLAILVVKHFADLRRLPGLRGRMYRGVQSIVRDTTASG
ncbi:MAG: glycerol-3-phosphate acyltransferase [Dehalococcoidales bacterium]|nr:glycerol-3-phosphate acyltransferase [Dehalococcoidales bacterium]